MTSVGRHVRVEEGMKGGRRVGRKRGREGDGYKGRMKMGRKESVNINISVSTL